ncbi:triphosphoribosyl-dephospho-CoA synthase [uncultured Limnobacter sp.]|uniref:triphosphoribosyl-dephospho-CoA synthase n=1 Tax=uncultured Limnobacter sp. TaxID=199681 RepID=UPI0030F9F9A9
MKELVARIDAAACDALLQEVALEYKPGLVCPSRNGSHADMNCSTFKRSIQALQGYFGECFAAGVQGAEFRTLQRLGLSAEQAMLKTTAGVNTHKGAIFLMGLLAGAAGVQFREYGCFEPIGLGRLVAAKWGVNILLAGVQDQVLCADTPTHGRRVRDAFGLPGAREQAAEGFPVLFWTTVPQLRWALSEGLSQEQAQLHALVCTIGKLPDTNLAHRGGLKGLQWAQGKVDQFLAEGGVFAPGWRLRAEHLCEQFEAQWLSPGGSADLLSAALFVQALVQVNSELPRFMTARQ